MDRKRIDRIIEIKERFRKDKEREIEEAAKKLAALCEEVLSVEKEITRHYGQIGAAALSGNDFAVIRDYLEYLDISKNSLLCEKGSMEEAIDLLRQEFYELVREMKMLGKLREKMVRAFRKTENRREQKLLDEMALRLDDKRI